MKPSPKRSTRGVQGNKRLRHLLAAPGLPKGWIAGTLLLYGVAGLILATFPAPYWIWTLALAGILAQALALAGARALAQFRWLPANLLTLLAMVGSGAFVAALAIALNYAGSDDLDQVSATAAVWQVMQLSLVALVVAALCAVISTEVGDRLLQVFSRLQTSLILAALSVLGLGLGGLIGLAVSPTTV
ncbi:hypothetical protein XM38_034910 [Halomicronema hongdechloris C2206]|uniref:Uncharacterized protein n=1 Tax=Halomicronema hongdechloris C2206 TaxID=1641165 RepID=A0A1Z3HQF1_9CYAN|nr:hypothetical protein [Halomicronema hongdechloris]ASC72533.1 hypothetical protein XM38_034910 [Halomicronema hongdechloris C2206]